MALLQTVALQNKYAHSMVVVVEPWGEEFVLQPGERLAVEFEAPHRDRPVLEEIDVDIASDRVILWAPRESMYKARRLPPL